MNLHFPGRSRSGFTLIELVIVVAILAALAGILLPLFPNMLMRGHASAGATNLGEIAKQVQMFAATHGDNYPDQYDSIAESSGIATYVPNGGALIAAPPSANDLSALNSVGITAVMPMVEQSAGTAGSWNPTFYPYAGLSTQPPTPTTLTTSVNVAFLDPNVAADKFALSITGRYIVFGLGKYSTIAGVGMDEAPVWYNPTQGFDSDTVYARFGLVYQTADANGLALSRATFVGAVEFAPWGTMTKDDNLSYYYTLK